MVASVADRASYRPKSVTSQRDFPIPSRHRSARLGLPSNFQGDSAYRCPQQPPHHTTPARPVLAGPHLRPRTAHGPMTPTGPGLKSSRAAGWRRSWTCRSFRPRRTSYPWLSLRATRSKGYAIGLPVGACRRIGRVCIRGRREVVADGSDGWCGQIEAGVKTQRGAGP
jgi:hypothetical protein